MSSCFLRRFSVDLMLSHKQTKTPTNKQKGSCLSTKVSGVDLDTTLEKSEIRIDTVIYFLRPVNRNGCIRASRNEVWKQTIDR